MNLKQYILHFYFFLLPFIVFSQNSVQPQLIINEIGFATGTNDEFIELLVLGSNVNLAGWTIDNFEDDEIKDLGYIQLAPDFPLLPEGTPIVIYNDNSYFSDVQSVNNGQLNANGFYQIPFSSSLIIKINTLQNRSSGQSDLWENYISFNNSRNGLFIMDSNNSPRANITWGMLANATNTTNTFIANSTLGGFNPNTSSLLLSLPCSETTGETGWGVDEISNGGYLSSSVKSSVGRANNPANLGLIGNVQNGNPAFSSIAISCEIIRKPDFGDSNGQVQSSVNGGIPPYSISIEGPTINPSISMDGATVFNLGNLTSGSYFIEILDSEGCKSSCSIFLPENIDAGEPCGSDKVTIGRDLTEDECGFIWEPKDGLLEPNSSITEVDMLPGEEKTYELKISDGNGGIASVEEYVASLSENIVVKFDRDEINYCGQDFNLEAIVEGEGNLTYNWTTIPAINLSEVNSPEILVSSSEIENISNVSSEIVFTVSVSNDNGCETEASIAIPIYPDLYLEIYGPEYFCLDQTVQLNATSGYTSYQWNTGYSGPTTTASETGIYHVTATDAFGCTQSSSLNVIESDFPDEDGDGLCSNNEDNDNDPCDPEMQISVSAESELCSGESEFLALSIENGVEPFSIEWTLSGAGQSIIVENRQYIKISTPSTSWNVVLFDVNNCEVSLSGNVQYSDFLDSDGDGVCDDVDCDPNDSQAIFDTDGDGICDIYDCDPNNQNGFVDADQDGICENIDCDDLDANRGMGMPCNDENPCTSNDTFNQNCECIGNPTPNCQDCLEGSPCDDDNPCTRNDLYGNDCDCAGIWIEDCFPCEIDSPCDDGNECTTNDVFNEFCGCEGVAIVGCSFCDVGKTCDDSNPCTIDDKFDANCNCVGTNANEFEIIVERSESCESNEYRLSLNKSFDDVRWNLNGIEVGSGPTHTSYQGGYYTARVYTEDNCSYSNGRLIDDNDLFNEDLILASSETVCSSSENVVLSLPDSYTNISWTDQNGIEIPSTGTSNSIEISGTGTYIANASNEHGCEIRASKKISFAPGEVKIEPENPFLCGGENVTLKCIPPAHFDLSTWSIRWYNSAGNIIGTSLEQVVSSAEKYRVKLTNPDNCETEDEITVSDDSNVIDVLIENGFTCVRFNRGDPLFTGESQDSRSSLTDCKIVDLAPSIDFEIILENGEKHILAEYLQSFLDPVCEEYSNAGGVVKDEFCSDLEEPSSLQKFLDFGIDYDGGRLLAYVDFDENTGEGCLYLLNALFPTCPRTNWSANPEGFVNVLNSLFCGLELGTEIFLPDVEIDAINYIFSGKKVTLFDGNVYTNNDLPKGFLFDNYHKGRRVSNYKDDVNIENITSYCFSKSGSAGMNTVWYDVQVDGNFVQYSFPYVDTELGSLILVFNKSEDIKFNNLYENSKSIAEDNFKVENIDLMAITPSCFLNSNQACLIFGNIYSEILKKTISPSEVREATLNLLTTTENSIAGEIIDCHETEGWISPFLDYAFVSRGNRIDYFRSLYRTYTYDLSERVELLKIKNKDHATH